MNPTQKAIVDQLTAEYGIPDNILVNMACLWLAAGLVVRVDWHRQERHLFILPNGERLSWQSQ